MVPLSRSWTFEPLLINYNYANSGYSGIYVYGQAFYHFGYSGK